MDINALTEKVIGAAFRLHNTLGFGFLESVCENALALELKELDLPFQTQAPVQVSYRDHVVGNFVADMLVASNLILELKSVASLTTAHEVQLVNYLTATKMENGLLINFGPDKVEVKRKFKTLRMREE